MKKEIKEVDKKQGIVQITTYDERWYAKPIENSKTKLPEFKFVPSVTWICESYPKGIGFYKWLAQKGWDEAEALKIAAGEKGSKVHIAIENLLKGVEVKIDSKYLNKSIDQEEELSTEEYEAIMSFADWYKATKPSQILAQEIVVFNDKDDYAGTIDLICVINNEVWIIDFKTSQNIWPTHELQLSAYKNALKDKDYKIKDISKVKLGILQVGYKRNRNCYKFTEIEDKFNLFLNAKSIWANDNSGVSPKQKDFPVSLSLNNKVK